MRRANWQAWGAVWALTCAMVWATAACGTDTVVGADPQADAESADDAADAWHPTPKDVVAADAQTDVTDAADVRADSDGGSAGDVAADTVADGSADGGNDAVDAAGDATVIIQDIGGGLPNYVASIQPTTSLFDPVGIHEVALTVDPVAWKAYLDGVNKPDGQQVYTWVNADVNVDGITYKNLGIKGFGNGSQLDNPAKPNIRLKFDQFDNNGIGPQGEKAFRLKAAGQDPTFIREPVAGAMLRAVGGQAPLFSWAHVTVNGEDFGPYLLQESVDKRYFHNHFGNNDGIKYDVTIGCGGINCPGGNCAAVASRFTASAGDTQPLVGLAYAVATATDADLPAVLDQYFVLDELLADYAVDATLSNLDGYASSAQNFTYYADEKTHKLHLIATGTDLTFGYFGDAWYALATPWGPPDTWCTRVDDVYLRIWNHPVLRAKLLEKFAALQCGLFAESTLGLVVDSYQKALAPWVVNEPKGIYTPAQTASYYKAMRTYIHKRQATLSDLLGTCP